MNHKTCTAVTALIYNDTLKSVTEQMGSVNGLGIKTNSAGITRTVLTREVKDDVEVCLSRVVVVYKTNIILHRLTLKSSGSKTKCGLYGKIALYRASTCQRARVDRYKESGWTFSLPRHHLSK